MISDHWNYFIDKLGEESGVFLGQEEIGTQSRRTTQRFLNFVVCVDVVRNIERTRFRVVVAENLDVGNAFPPTDVNITV